MSIFDYAIKLVIVTLVVLGAEAVIIALSGVDMALADDHGIFRYRMHAAGVLIAGYLVADYLWSRRRARPAGGDEGTPDQDAPKRGFVVELIALGFVAVGWAAFWHDHVTHEIPNPVAVTGKFVSATCVASGKRSGPHMSIGYEFPSQSSQARAPTFECFVDRCEGQDRPVQHMDTEYKRVFYASLPDCQAALPAVLASSAPTTVWTGDTGRQAAVRARFTPERETPPYFLLWLPLVVAVMVWVASIVQRTRRPRQE